MLIIAIDGACRRNGQPDCVAAGGVFIQNTASNQCCTITKSNYNSTNQRGELVALHQALEYVRTQPASDVCVVTDSEYLFNAMHKEWVHKWAANDWRLVTGGPVKNGDLWRLIYDTYQKCVTTGKEIVFTHIKGHCIPFGTVTATSTLAKDNTGTELYVAALQKYDSVYTTKKNALDYAQDLSERNNGFRFSDKLLRMLVAMNVVADAVATKAVEEADRELLVGIGRS